MSGGKPLCLRQESEQRDNYQHTHKYYTQSQTLRTPGDALLSICGRSIHTKMYFADLNDWYANTDTDGDTEVGLWSVGRNCQQIGHWKGRRTERLAKHHWRHLQAQLYNSESHLESNLTVSCWSQAADGYLVSHLLSPSCAANPVEQTGTCRRPE